MSRHSDWIRSEAIRLARAGKLTTAELADAVHVSPRGARAAIEKLRKSGVIAQVGTTRDGRGRPFVVYGVPKT